MSVHSSEILEVYRETVMSYFPTAFLVYIHVLLFEASSVKSVFLVFLNNIISKHTEVVESSSIP